jgi:hypothetical protein
MAAHPMGGSAGGWNPGGGLESPGGGKSPLIEAVVKFELSDSI